MGNIAFIVDQPPTHRDLERWFVFDLSQEGFNVLVFDLTGFLHPEFYKTHGKKASDDVRVQPFNDIRSFEKSFAEFNPEWTFFLINLALDKNFFRTFLIQKIAKKRSKLIGWRGPEAPFASQHLVARHQCSIGKISRLAFITIRLKSIISSVFVFAFRGREEYGIVSGHVSENKIHGEAIYLHARDFEIFLASKDRYFNRPEEPYLLFLDEDYVFHSDYMHAGVTAPVTVEAYYSEVNYMLREIGRELKLNVLIQPHPRAEIENVSRYFKHPISDIKTVDAVAGASVVITHDSTAIGFGVLFDKPMLLLTTSEIQQSTYQANVDNFAEELGLSVVSVNEMPFKGGRPFVDQYKYESYKNKYLRVKGHDGRRGQKILSELFNRSNKQGLPNG